MFYRLAYITLTVFLVLAMYSCKKMSSSVQAPIVDEPTTADEPASADISYRENYYGSYKGTLIRFYSHDRQIGMNDTANEVTFLVSKGADYPYGFGEHYFGVFKVNILPSLHVIAKSSLEDTLMDKGDCGVDTTGGFVYAYMVDSYNVRINEGGFRNDSLDFSYSLNNPHHTERLIIKAKKTSK